MSREGRIHLRLLEVCFSRRSSFSCSGERCGPLASILLFIHEFVSIDKQVHKIIIAELVFKDPNDSGTSTY